MGQPETIRNLQAESPTVPLRSEARHILRAAGHSNSFIKTVLGFVDAIVYTREGVGDPEYHKQQALKTAQKFGCCEEEIAQAQDWARKICEDYWTGQTAGREPPQKKKPVKTTIAIKISSIADQERLMQLANTGMDRDLVSRQGLGEERFQLYKDYVKALLSGQILTKAEIANCGLEPDRIRKTAVHIYLKYLDTEMLPYFSTPGLSRRLTGTNPHYFLGDSSGHKQMGYIQSQQEPRD